MIQDADEKQVRAERLRIARKNAGFDDAQQAVERFGWNYTTYAAHENGQNGYTRQVAKYAKAFKTSIGYLLLGEVAKPALVASYDPDAPEDDLPDAPSGAVSSDGRRRGIPPGEIPHIDAALGMGVADDSPQISFTHDGHTIGAANVLGTWKLPDFVVQRVLKAPLGRVHIVECEGRSMEPLIMDGDFVVVDETKTNPRMPGVFALWEGDGVTIKNIELVPGSDPLRIRLIPENDKFSSYERQADEVQIIGRYAGRFTVR